MGKKKSKAESEYAAQRALVEHLLTYTARLVRLNNGRPESGGSGILYHANGRLLLFSVLHVFEKDGWFMETDYVVGRSTLSLELPTINWLGAAPLKDGKLTAPDEPDGFAWAEFDLPKLKEKLKVEQEKHGKAIELPIYKGPIDELAHANEPFGFAALPPREFVPGLRGLVREPVFELYMTYEGDDARGFNQFRLARSHQGDSVYKGSSGAPIVDQSGRIVALVQGGCKARNLIFGVPLSRFAKYIDLPLQSIEDPQAK